MRYKYVLIPLLLLILISGFIYYKSKAGAASKSQIVTQKVEKATLISSISASGQFLTANQFPITITSTGLVKQVFVKEGDTVVAGQKIAELQQDNASLQKSTSAYASYLSAKSGLVSAQTTTYTLQSSLFAANQKFINDAVARDLAENDPTYIQQNADWLAAESKYKNQSQLVSEAKQNLQSAWLNYQSLSPIISAPTAGKILSLTVVPGMSLSSTSTRIAVISTPGLPLATFNVTELDVPKLRPSQKATIKIDSMAGKTFTGRVVTVDRVGTVTSNVTSYPMIIQLDTEVPGLLSNMSSTANVIIDIKENVLAIPTSAINNGSVKILKAGRELTMPVEVGISSDTQTEIISGLSEGDEVIVSSPASPAVRNSSGTSIFGGSGIRVGGGGAGIAFPR